MKILAIDTSCDETAVAITSERRVLANVLYSQVLLHREWGGVVPSIAKRAHEERIDWVISEACRRFLRRAVKQNGATRDVVDAAFQDIDYVAVTQGPGLAIALEVGIRKAKELARKYGKPLVPVNHMEGHIYSCFVQNGKGNPQTEIVFPFLALLVSGGHTELVLVKDHGSYEVVGQTRDDAAGEALDKAARLLGIEYPGGPVIERLAKIVGNKDYYNYPRPMYRSNNYDFSFSGLKTAVLYCTKKMSDKERVDNINRIASSFQEAVVDTLVKKTEDALIHLKIDHLVVGGGVIANQRLRQRMRQMIKAYNKTVVFPPYKYLTGDNASMIGVAAHINVMRGNYLTEVETVERLPRMAL